MCVWQYYGKGAVNGWGSGCLCADKINPKTRRFDFQDGRSTNPQERDSKFLITLRRPENRVLKVYKSAWWPVYRRQVLHLIYRTLSVIDE